MSENTNKNPSQLSEERVDNLFRIMAGPNDTTSSALRLTLKVRAYLDKIYLDGFAEGMEVGMNKEMKEL